MPKLQHLILSRSRRCFQNCKICVNSKWKWIAYQRILCLILIECSDSCPVELFQKSKSWLIELIFRRHNPEEVREAFGGKHGVSVSVGDLQTKVMISQSDQYKSNIFSISLSSHLNQIPVSGGLDDLVRYHTTGTSKQYHLLWTIVYKFEKGAKTNPGIALKR